MKRSPLSMLQPTGKWAWAMAAVGVAVIVGSVAIFFAGREPDIAVEPVPTTTQATTDPGPTVDEFLAAWAASDWATVRRLVADPEAGADVTLADWFRDLEVLAVRLTPATPQPADDAFVAPFHVAVDIDAAGTWEYESSLRVVPAGAAWKIAWSAQTVHPALADGDRFELATDWAERAAITARDGSALVKSVPGIAVGIIPERVASRDDVAAALDETLEVSRGALDAALDRPGIEPDWFLPVATISREENIDVRPALYPVPGVAFRLVEGRAPVDSQLGALLWGSTGEITAEQLVALGPPYAAGMVVGRSGLEAAFERQLAGTPTTRILKRSPDGSTEGIAVLDGTPPGALQTTVSVAAQRAAEAVLRGVDSKAAIVAIDAPSGEIRAAAATPSDGFNLATSGLYPPGSTFKIVVAAALLEDGLKPADTVSCPPTVTVAGREFGNSTRLPATMTFEQAFARSCNTAFIELGTELDPAVLAEVAGRFGFGASVDIGLPAADASFDPSSDPVETAASMIGQGRVLASPLNLAGVAATAASGAWRPPTLITGEGAEPSAALDATVLTDLQAMMRSVVLTGTGRPARVADLDVAGKTGTAQIVTTAGPDTVAWFIGFSGDLAFAVAVEGGASGGDVAGPLAAAFLEELETLQQAGPAPECVAAGADWLTFQGDMTRAGCSQAEPIRQPRRLWQAEVGISAWLNSPIVTRGLVVVGSAGTRRAAGDDGDGVYALDLRTGRQRWHFEAATDVNGVAAAGDLVVATGDEGEVWGIDLATGTQQWSFAAGSPVFTNPLIVEERIIVGDASGTLWALDLEGRELWRVRLDGPIRGGAASDGRLVYAVSDRGEAGAFTLDGFEMWRTRIELPPSDEASAEGATPNPISVFATPTVAEDLLVVAFVFEGGPPAPALVGLDRFVGALVWWGADPDGVADSFASLRNSPARHGEDLIAAGSLSYGVQGIEAASGRVDWITETGIFCERQWASPVVVGDLVLLPRPDGAVHAYEASSGDSVWRYSPAIPGAVATLATCTGGGQQIQDGLELQASVAIAPDGSIIVASTSQLIYAIGGS